MKTSIAVIAIGLCLGTPLLAQESEKPKAPQGTKIGFVNLKIVYERYTRVIEWQGALAENLEPYKIAKKPAKKSGELSDESHIFRSQGRERELEKLRIETNRLIDEKYADKKAAITKEVNKAIEAVAKAYGFKIVLGHGVPNFLTDDVFGPMPATVQQDGIVPLYIDGSVDLTGVVVNVVNKWAPDAPAGEISPPK